MGSCCITQGAQRGALWRPRGVGWGVVGGRLKTEGINIYVCMCVCVHTHTYGWFTLLYGRNQHNIVKQLKFLKIRCRFHSVVFKSFLNLYNFPNLSQIVVPEHPQQSSAVRLALCLVSVSPGLCYCISSASVSPFFFIFTFQLFSVFHKIEAY